MPQTPKECTTHEQVDDLDSFVEAIDKSLTEQFGPNHQELFANSGEIVSSFEWRDNEDRTEK